MLQVGRAGMAADRAAVDQDEDAAGAGTTPAPEKPRKRKVAKRKPARWSAALEKRFLAALVETLNVAKSVRIAKTSESSVYRHRQQSEAFRAAWAQAIREGYAQLELQLLERAVKGVVKPVFFGGKRIANVTEFSDRAALALLARRREEEGGGVAPSDDEATVRRRMTERLAEMAARLAEAQRADDAA